MLRVLGAMEAAVEEPLGRDALAALAGVSLRQLERLFAAHLGRTVSDTYLEVRLAQAEQLLRSTGMTVTAVAMACGFPSASHFSRCYARRFGLAPSRARGLQAPQPLS